MSASSSAPLAPSSRFAIQPRHAALAAAAMLVVIQVGMGIIIKASQTGGSYAFSPSSSVSISETLKMLLSTAFFWKECTNREKSGSEPSRKTLGDYTRVDTNGEDADMLEMAGADGEKNYRSPQALTLSRFHQYLRGEVPRDTIYGFCNLAMFYVLINNLVFVSYKLADPGTISLTKSAVTFITAFVMVFTIGTRVSVTQWIAICFQICGLSVTQYNPNTNGTTYPTSTYLILLFQVFLSASAGIYNQALLKADNSSLHANNMVLYAAGAVINVICHFVISLVHRDEPGFFEGYNNVAAILLIMSNVLIGLAITAVYRYADAVIKCFATAIATAILLYLSPLLFGTSLNFLVIPGTIVIFLASWLYMTYPPAPITKDPSTPQPPPTMIIRMLSQLRPSSKQFVSIMGALTISIVAMVSISDMSGPAAQAGSKIGKVESPFQSTMAIIRINADLPERIHLFQRYEPFFHTLHISMPGLVKAEPWDFHNISHDQYPGLHPGMGAGMFSSSFLAYEPVSWVMQRILDEEPGIDGIYYFHFDAWVDPLAWTGFNKERIRAWIPTCRKTTEGWDWLGWGMGYAGPLDAGRKAVDAAGLGNATALDYCQGWYDTYYIPRAYFADFIALSKIYAESGAFQELVIADIVTLIDQANRPSQYQSIKDDLTECWGDCCTSNPSVELVMGHRCGHKLDYRWNHEQIQAQWDKLDREAELLGSRNAGLKSFPFS